MSIVPTLFLGVEYCATFQAALYIETHSLMHQSEFHAASVALSRAADKRKSLINIHKNGYTATLTTIGSETGSKRWLLLPAKPLGTGNPILWELTSNTGRLHCQYNHPHFATRYGSLEMCTATNKTLSCTSAVFLATMDFCDVTH